MPDAVVDIGNSRIKFARVESGSIQLPVRGLPAQGCHVDAEEPAVALDRGTRDIDVIDGMAAGVMNDRGDGIDCGNH